MKLFLTVITGVLTAFFILSLPINARENTKVLDIKKITSTDGVNAWLVEDHSLPIIALSFSFKHAGAIQDSKEKQGLARLLSNTLDEGAGELKSQEFQKTLSDNSITLYFNSGRDNFGGQLKTLSRNKDKAFELLKLALTSPRFDAEPVERMKQANISRIRSSMGDPNWINARLFNDVAFAGHPYALNSGGTITSLTNITPDDLRQRTKDWLTKDRLVIGVAGDINATELTRILDDVFGDLPQTGSKNTTSALELTNQGKTFIYNKDIPQTIVSSALPAFDKNDPDYDALRLMNYIYGGGGFGSKLMEEAREKRGLTYGIYSSLLMQDYLSALSISTSTKNESAKEILGIINSEMKNLKDTPLSESELADAKSYIIGAMPLGLTSTDKIAGTLLALQLDDRDINYLDQFKDNIEQVTLDDIKKVANRILDPSKLLTVLVGKPENINGHTQLKELPNVQ